MNVSSAQLAESIHQSFEMDDYNSVYINLKGEVEVETWAGNTVLTETKIKLYDASKGILDYFIKLGRYEIETTNSSSRINLKSKDIVRRPIRTKNGECYEEVKVRVFLPDDFEAETKTVWVRKKEVDTAEKETPSTETDSLNTTIKKDSLIKEETPQTVIEEN